MTGALPCRYGRMSKLRPSSLSAVCRAKLFSPGARITQNGFSLQGLNYYDKFKALRLPDFVMGVPTSGNAEQIRENTSSPDYQKLA